MALSKKDIERINLMNPVANDLKLGDIIQEVQEGEGAQGPKGEKGDPGPQGPQGEPGADGEDGFPTEQQWNDLVARVAALEGES